jgi:hypothetical protein
MPPTITQKDTSYTTDYLVLPPGENYFNCEYEKEAKAEILCIAKKPKGDERVIGIYLETETMVFTYAQQLTN